MSRALLQTRYSLLQLPTALWRPQVTTNLFNHCKQPLQPLCATSHVKPLAISTRICHTEGLNVTTAVKGRRKSTCNQVLREGNEKRKLPIERHRYHV